MSGIDSFAEVQRDCPALSPFRSKLIAVASMRYAEVSADRLDHKLSIDICSDSESGVVSHLGRAEVKLPRYLTPQAI
jgi:hypothetical protein